MRNKTDAKENLYEAVEDVTAHGVEDVKLKTKSQIEDCFIKISIF